MRTKMIASEELAAGGATERTLAVAASALRLVGEASSERELMQGLCDLLVEQAGYRLAWIGTLEREPERVVEPVAWTGDSDYVREARVRWDDDPRGRGPAGRAAREGKTVAVNAAAADVTFEPWAEAARARGYAALCALPLSVDGAVIGLLLVYAGRENAFDAHEIERLEELVAAAARGIELFRARAETRAALEEARTARDQLRAVYDASPDAIFLHAGDGRILDVNENVFTHHGITREVVLHGDPAALVGEPYTFEQALANIARAIREGRLDFEWNLRSADGHLVPVEIRLRRLPGYGGGDDEPALVAVVRDMTEQRRLEAQLLQRAKLDSLASFAGGVAHDFNNFLTAVLGALSLAMRDLGPHHPMRALLEDAIEGAARARGLTRQLLAYARGGASFPSVFALRPLIDQTARLALAGTAVTTRVDIAPGLWPLDADRDQIAQVFHNLFLNAAQAMPKGAITITAENVTIDDGDRELPPGRYVRVAVRDTGPGIDPEHLSRIFDPFFTTKANGTGLGLPTAFAVARGQGGGRGVASRGGVGTRFTVVLRGSERELGRPEIDAPREARRLRVLVLEDEPPLRRVFMRMLEQMGHEGMEAEHGDAALEIARVERDAGRPIDVAVLDLTIRGGRGAREILPELRETLPSATVIGMSGYSDVAPSEVPFDAFLAKPFGYERLETALSEVRGGSSDDLA